MAKKTSISKLFSFDISLKTIGIFLLIIVALSFFGTGDEESINLYMKKLQVLSEHKINPDQRYKVKRFYLENKNRHPELSERKAVRAKFNSLRPYLRKQWSDQYKMIWPLITISKKNRIINQSFQAHHIVPINAGGINKWWNLTPLTPSAHKVLHSSLEEKACFAHNAIELHCYRFLLRIQDLGSRFLHNKPYYKPPKFKYYQKKLKLNLPSFR